MGERELAVVVGMLLVVIAVLGAKLGGMVAGRIGEVFIWALVDGSITSPHLERERENAKREVDAMTAAYWARQRARQRT